MINENNVKATTEERILHHKNMLDNRLIGKREPDNNDKKPFLYQSIACMFIFAIILVLKLVNDTQTIGLTYKLSNLLEKDQTENIMAVIKNEDYLNFNFESVFASPDEYDSIEINENSLNETVENEEDDTLVPQTEFTIDVNMLDEVNKESDLVGKK